MDCRMLEQDEEGKELMRELESVQCEHKRFIDTERKRHEQMVREHKEFITLMNKIKTNNQLKGKNGIDELLREC